MKKASHPTCKNCSLYIDRPCHDLPLGEFIKPGNKKTIKWCNYSSKQIRDFGKDVSSCLGYLTQNIIFRIKELQTQLHRYNRAVELLEGGEEKWVNVKNVKLIVGQPYIIKIINCENPITNSEPIVCTWEQRGWTPVDKNVILEACFSSCRHIIEVLV